MLNIGIIGCGGMGGHHARQINGRTDARVAGVADSISEKASSLAQEIGATPYADFHDLLPHVDAVMICTPPFARTEVVVDCASAGKPVFAEKPIALHMEDANRMIDAVERAGVFMMMGYVLRFTHPFQALAETFASGELGRLVNCWTRRYMPYDTSTRWYGDQSKSGGVTLDFASHDIDWIRWVGGEVRQVFGHVDRVRAGIQTDEHVHALMTFADGVGSIDDSWAPGLSESSIGIVGSRGSMIVDRSDVIRKRVGDGEEVEVAPEQGETIQTHFIRCIRDGLTPKVTGYDGRAILEIVLAIQESARTSRAVEMEKS